MRAEAATSKAVLAPRNSIAAAAAKSLQLCPTLCDPTDDSPPSAGLSSHGVCAASVVFDSLQPKGL